MIKNIIKMIIPGYFISKKIYYRYKLSNFLYKHGLNILSQICTYRLYKKYNCCISGKAVIGKNVEFPHPVGIVIGEGVKIGDNCVIYQNVTLGRKNRDIADYPTIGNDVIIYCNSTVIGNVKIGDNSIIGCNTVVMKSVEKNSVCIGVVK